jgi:hypothetical protein
MMKTPIKCTLWLNWLNYKQYIDSQKLLLQILLMKFIYEILFASLVVNLTINIKIEIGKTFAVNKTNSIFYIYYLFWRRESI